ncbi:uncharacterized protein LOC135822720 [Sycon ciliatum]|uniref:uncharacterized protein LOC135822720 n=1 Tax=Sycon ciliatum TaxID=27933 RepID=UPI0031F6917A
MANSSSSRMLSGRCGGLLVLLVCLALSRHPAYAEGDPAETNQSEGQHSKPEGPAAAPAAALTAPPKDGGAGIGESACTPLQCALGPVLSGCSAPSHIYQCSNLSLSTFSLSTTSSATELDLSHNQLSSPIGQGDFPAKLTKLNYAFNSIRLGITFELPISVIEVDLSHNSMPELRPHAIVQGDPTLATLDLSFNNISSLQAGSFAGLSNLRTLDLSFNQLSTLTTEVVNGLANLETLDLSFNRLSSLSAGVFKGMDKLKTLQIQGAFFQQIPVEEFTALTSLTLLNFKHIHQYGCGATLKSMCDLQEMNDTNTKLHVTPFFLSNNKYALSEIKLYCGTPSYVQANGQSKGLVGCYRPLTIAAGPTTTQPTQDRAAEGNVAPATTARAVDSAPTTKAAAAQPEEPLQTQNPQGNAQPGPPTDPAVPAPMTKAAGAQPEIPLQTQNPQGNAQPGPPTDPAVAAPTTKAAGAQPEEPLQTQNPQGNAQPGPPTDPAVPATVNNQPNSAVGTAAPVQPNPAQPDHSTSQGLSDGNKAPGADSPTQPADVPPPAGNLPPADGTPSPADSGKRQAAPTTAAVPSLGDKALDQTTTTAPAPATTTVAAAADQDDKKSIDVATKVFTAPQAGDSAGDKAPAVVTTPKAADSAAPATTPAAANANANTSTAAPAPAQSTGHSSLNNPAAPKAADGTESPAAGNGDNDAGHRGNNNVPAHTPPASNVIVTENLAENDTRVTEATNAADSAANTGSSGSRTTTAPTQPQPATTRVQQTLPPGVERTAPVEGTVPQELPPSSPVNPDLISGAGANKNDVPPSSGSGSLIGIAAGAGAVVVIAVALLVYRFNSAAHKRNLTTSTPSRAGSKKPILPKASTPLVSEPAGESYECCISNSISTEEDMYCDYETLPVDMASLGKNGPSTIPECRAAYSSGSARSSMAFTDAEEESYETTPAQENYANGLQPAGTPSDDTYDDPTAVAIASNTDYANNAPTPLPASLQNYGNKLLPNRFNSVRGKQSASPLKRKIGGSTRGDDRQQYTKPGVKLGKVVSVDDGNIFKLEEVVYDHTDDLKNLAAASPVAESDIYDCLGGGDVQQPNLASQNNIDYRNATDLLAMDATTEAESNYALTYDTSIMQSTADPAVESLYNMYETTPAPKRKDTVAVLEEDMYLPASQVGPGPAAAVDETYSDLPCLDMDMEAEGLEEDIMTTYDVLCAGGSFEDKKAPTSTDSAKMATQPSRRFKKSFRRSVKRS